MIDCQNVFKFIRTCPWIRCLVFSLKFQKNDNLIAPFKSAVNIMEQLFFISYIRKYINSGSI